MDQPWAAYVTLSDAFSPAEREAMTAAFDQIAAFRDDEGMELLRTAFANNGNRPLVIELDARRSAYSDGVVDINFRQIQEARINGVAPSIVAVLVHELYHAADSQRDLLAQARSVLLDMAGITADDPRAARLIAYAEAGFQLPNTSINDQARDLVGSLVVDRAPPRPVSEADAARGLGAVTPVMPFDPEMNALLQRTPVRERIQAVLDAGILGPESINEQGQVIRGYALRLEQDAASYTDALMAKNYGDAEPIRGLYSNTDERQQQPPQQDAQMTYLLRALAAGESAGFQALPYSEADPNDIAPPQVRATRDPSEINQR